MNIEMAKIESDEVDLYIDAENVSFLSNCFDNSFALQSSLNYVKDYVAQIQNEVPVSKSFSSVNKRNANTLLGKRSSLNCSLNNNEIISQLQENTQIFKKKLSNWGLPSNITAKYEQKGITEMFNWQVQCLCNSKVLLDSCNLVYSAPTSAGKTLVAEILTIKTILERQKKVIMILPFVSIVREKMFYLQDILSGSGVRVEGFMGSQSPPGGLQAVHLAICTIEKANSLVNKLIDEGNISELGAVIVDELHLLGDPHRGYILELLLTKIKYLSSKLEDVNIQIIGMSATLPNLQILSIWLEAELFITEFRPIPLDEYCLVGNKYYDKTGNYVTTLKKSKEDLIEGDGVLNLCLETINEGCSVLIFCMTKNRCESLAQSIATSFFKLGCSKSSDGVSLRDQLNSEKISEVLEQLQNCPVGLDQILKNIVSFGVAYHHAGLTFDERDIIEGAFKSGAVRVLIATSTLSSGVNLPARKVIIRSPVFQRQPINILTYKQMVGRAGRMGRDTKGESILMCTQAEQKIGFDLMKGNLDPVKSCIDSEDKFMRAVLEMIASQAGCTKYELELYSRCTLLYSQQEKSSQDHLLENTLKLLINFELVRVQIDNDDTYFVATSLGKACLASSMAPNDGISLFCELQKARQCLVLENDLHLIYLVTPYSVSNQWNNIDWLHLLTLWESLTSAMKRVGELVGVQESFIIRSLRGVNKSSNSLDKLNIHKRFYTALALQDLVNEKPLSEVAHKFQCARGFLQGLQQSSATFAGMVTAFCHQLGWKNMEMLISQFQDRLHFGIHSDLLELMKLTSLNGVRARTLFNAGFETIARIASANVSVIENTLHKSVPFQSEKEREGDDDADIRKRNKMRNIWITGCCGMTTKEAAENLILEARKYLQLEIGVTDIKWGSNINNVKGNENEINGNEIVLYTEKEQEKFNKSEQMSKTEINIFACETKIKSPNISPDININSNKLQNTSNENYYPDIVNKSIQMKLEHDDLDDLYNKQDISKIKNVPLLEKDCNINATSFKEELIWDSLVLSETVLGNITKSRTSLTIISPNISFEGSDYSPHRTNEAIKSNNSVKDISLFSSEDNNSSLFEESLPIDSVSDSMSDKNENSSTFDRDTSSETINSNTILNAFKSSIIDIEEDEDIKLVYEDELKVPEIVTVPANNIFANKTNNKITKVSPTNGYFKSPRKRHADTSKYTPGCSTKKIKPMKFANEHEDNKNVTLKCSQSDKFTLKLKENEIKCFVLKGEDILDNLAMMEKKKEVSLLLDNNFEHKTNTNLIGDMICKGNKFSIKSQAQNFKEIVKGVTTCIAHDVCLYYDLSSLEKSSSIMKSILERIFTEKSYTLKLSSTKSNFLNIKKWLNVDLLSRCIDISLIEWLLDSDENVSSIIDLTKKFCDIEISNAEICVNNEKHKYKNLDVIQSSCLKAWCIWCVAEKQKPFLEKYNFLEKILDIETQISKILAKCEFYGINVDKNLASQLLMDVKNSQDVLEKKAFKICGYRFNFNSSKDVAKVLGLYKGRKVSTKKSVLTAHNSPMASIVIYWRKLNSILTKTLYPLTEQASIYSADNRISPTYTMYTSTGRISMHEPNLQNVPRTFSIPSQFLTINEFQSNDDVIAFNCRNIFKAAPGYSFVSADYCQLEMRILTHYSRDVVLTKIMCSDADVFKSIAASWSSVPEEQVDEDLRQKAKQLCYGILYGMGNKTLSQHLDVTELEAAMFMDTFYNTYPAIKVFTQTVVEDCRKNGYVETLMKRRRYLQDINSTIGSKRSSAERQAINTTIQGSAADIAKAAMCAINSRTIADKDPPRLILQMHDELIYEVPESKKCTFPLILKEVMEDTVELNVPLPVKVRSGASWGSLVELNI